MSVACLQPVCKLGARTHMLGDASAAHETRDMHHMLRPKNNYTLSGTSTG